MDTGPGNEAGQVRIAIHDDGARPVSGSHINVVIGRASFLYDGACVEHNGRVVLYSPGSCTFVVHQQSILTRGGDC